jgi:hypothetical protein
MLEVALWGLLLLAAGAAALLLPVTRSRDAVSDVYLYSADAGRWEPLHAPPQGALVDGRLLGDGRVALSGVTALEPERPRPCDIWDPASRTWSRGSEVIAARDLHAPAPGGGARVLLEKGTVVQRWGASYELPGGKVVPAPPEAGIATTLIAVDERHVVAAGGLLSPAVRELRPAFLALRLLAGLAAVGLLLLAVRTLGRPTRPSVASIVAGLAVAWGGVPAAAYWLLRQLAWH